ncbi:MAG: hypothetical protein QM604_04935, partial [Microbacterium sp.]
MTDDDAIGIIAEAVPAIARSASGQTRRSGAERILTLLGLHPADADDAETLLGEDADDDPLQGLADRAAVTGRVLRRVELSGRWWRSLLVPT